MRMYYGEIVFVLIRIMQIMSTTIPVGLLGYFVHENDAANKLSPPEVLVPFIITILALAWTLFTMLNHRMLLRDRGIVALVDLLFLGAFIAAVYYMHVGGTKSCDTNSGGTTFKRCSMYKAAFAFVIIDLVTFFISLWVPTLPREDEAYASAYPHLPALPFMSSAARRPSLVVAPPPAAARRSISYHV